MTSLHTRFLALLPRIEAHAKFFFRHVFCRSQRADWIAEAIALAWKWFVQLEQRGKDAAQFIAVLAAYAVKAVRCGRCVAGSLDAKDVLNPRTQRKHGFTAKALPEVTSPSTSFTEALADNTVTPPPDAAAFRVDFPRWRRSLRARDQRLADALMNGERAHELAEQLGLSRARVTQLRQAMCADWDRFHGEACAAV